jgi:hypothetical protein
VSILVVFSMISNDFGVGVGFVLFHIGWNLDIHLQLAAATADEAHCG